MKKIRNLLIISIMFIFAACAPTVATKSITVITHPDGTETTSVTKSLSQRVDYPIVPSTTEVLNTFSKTKQTGTKLQKPKSAKFGHSDDDWTN